MFTEQLAALRLATPTSSPTRATARRHTCPTDDADNYNLSLQFGVPLEQAERSGRAHSLSSESSETSLLQHFESRIKNMTQSVCTNGKDAGRFLSLLERMVDLADQSRQAQPSEAATMPQDCNASVTGPTLQDPVSIRPSCMHRPYTTDAYWPGMQDESRDFLHGALESAYFSDTFTSSYPVAKSHSSTDLTKGGFEMAQSPAHNALGLSGLETLTNHKRETISNLRFETVCQAASRQTRPVRVNEYATVKTESWQLWLEPRQRVGASSEQVVTSMYRTLNDVRQDRKIKTNRSLAVIGRIPLKHYLEIGDDIAYRSVRRLARTVYAEWLQPNVRLAKQDPERMQACFHRLEYEFPVLGDCEKHWKARELMLQVIDNAIDETALRRRKALVLQPAALEQNATVQAPLSSPTKRLRDGIIDDIAVNASDKVQGTPTARRRLDLEAMRGYSTSSYQSLSPDLDEAVACTDSQGPVTPIDIAESDSTYPISASQGYAWDFALLDEQVTTVLSPPTFYDEAVKDAADAWDGDLLLQLW